MRVLNVVVVYPDAEHARQVVRGVGVRRRHHRPRDRVKVERLNTGLNADRVALERAILFAEALEVEVGREICVAVVVVRDIDEIPTLGDILLLQAQIIAVDLAILVAGADRLPEQIRVKSLATFQQRWVIE